VSAAAVRRRLDAVVTRSPWLRAMARRLLYARRGRSYRRVCQRVPVEPQSVIFECYAGRVYACSPRAIYRQMLADERFAGWTFIWAFREELVGLLAHPEAAERDFGAAALGELGRARIVKYGSQEYFEAHARAAYWVSNYILPLHMHVRPGQTYIQTWHGTPLKRLGCDIPPDKTSAMFRMDDVYDRYRREGARFTRLLSPSAYVSEKLASAFALTPGRAAGAIVELGYPRNDALRTATEGDVAEVRRRLGIPADRTVVLYAPTFRDDQRAPGVGYTIETGIDFDAFATRLGDTHVLLFRAHYLVASEVDFAPFGGSVIDVSTVSDINDLYLVSGVLVTDYSSVFFDYANLDRPMVFFPYDRERYAEELRGFYLDYDALPGPVVRTQEALFDAIEHATEDLRDRAAERERFRERFTPMDDGRASERVVDAIFGAPG